MKPKNIDRLFQEQLKNMEASPSPNVWTRIEAKLTKKKRRISPIWWFSAAAALLILAFFIVDFSGDKNGLQSIPVEQIITHREKEKIDKKSVKTKENTVKKVFFDKKTIVSVKKGNVNTNRNTSKKNLKALQNQSILLADKTMISTQKISKKPAIPIKPAIVQNTLKKDTIFTKKRTGKKGVHQLENKKNNQSKRRLLKRRFIAKSTLKSENNTKKSIQNKWTISPVIGVLNTIATSNESDIANSTAEFLPVTGTINRQEKNKAYGVRIAYQFHKKWALQSGVHLQEHRFSMSNIAVISNIATGKISYYLGGNSTNFSTGLEATASVLNTNSMAVKTYNYIEIPLEVMYTLIQTKKFNTRVVAGFSTLFLIKNNTTITSDEFFRNFAKDSNLNALNVSGNIGFDFNYFLGKKWKLSVNPMLKKQLNTFHKASANYGAFLLGIYTGVTYQF